MIGRIGAMCTSGRDGVYGVSKATLQGPGRSPGEGLLVVGWAQASKMGGGGATCDRLGKQGHGHGHGHDGARLMMA